MSSSLLAVVQNTPQIEPLPAYRRDPETSSIRSSAPSYTSEAPSYHSNYPSASASNVRSGLPPASYAPGFHHFRQSDRNGLSHLSFNMTQWSSAFNSPQAKHYHNVAARRTRLGMIDEQNLVAALANQTITPTVSGRPSDVVDQAPSAPSVAAASTWATAPVSEPSSGTATPLPRAPVVQTITPLLPAPSASTSTSGILPISPLEDPDLVGHAAASLARERRLYIARENRARWANEAREEQALREESRRWEFMLAQMEDWEEREQGWKAFKGRIAGNRRGSARNVLFRFWK